MLDGNGLRRPNQDDHHGECLIYQDSKWAKFLVKSVKKTDFGKAVRS